METNEDLRRLIAESQRKDREIIRSFVQGAISGDFELLSSSIGSVDTNCLWQRAFRSLAGHSIPRKVRTRFTEIWLRDGNHIRCEVGDDLILIAGLRALLPPYKGGPIRLYRGDSFWNRSRRTYGLSWSSELEVARGFAQGNWRTFEGGSVVLTTLASPEAIIGMPGVRDDRYGEKEYLVDRRLVKVELLERFSEVTPRLSRR